MAREIFGTVESHHSDVRHAGVHWPIEEKAGYRTESTVTVVGKVKAVVQPYYNLQERECGARLSNI